MAGIVGHLYGWKSKITGLRRYKELLLLVPRKNAKSLLGAGLALVELFMGDPNTPEIMIGSGDREQARQMFDTIKLMVQNEQELRSRLHVLKNVIKYPGNDGWLKVVSSESYNLHGANLSAGFVDETHIVKRDLVETMATSQGARQEPIFVNLSTAGYDRHGILFEKYEYAKKVRAGIIDDPGFMPVIYEADPADDWTDPATWEKANPNLGKSIFLDFLKRECERAQQSPAFESSFKRLYLNLWTESDNPWLQMARYDDCVGDLPDLKGRACYAGLDLSTTTDLSAFVLVFLPLSEGEPYYVLPFAWCPGDSIRDRSRRDKVPYALWRDKGHIEPTPGAVVNYDYIFKRVDQAAKDYDLKAVCFDDWGSAQIIARIENNGIEVIRFGQGYKSMSPPTKELMKLILERKIMFPENPVLRWCASNVVIQSDPAGNIKMNKDKSTEKIDLMVALVMGLDGCIRNKVETSVYTETRGMVFI
ncbi:MAG: terminase large subunit [Proteobacteria bacterium]|nr:terminase large subunit [Pseudomonadota bacterium]